LVVGGSRELSFPFFRYNYIISGKGYLRGKEWRLSVHGYVFTFSIDEDFSELVRNRVEDVFYSILGMLEWQNKEDWMEGEGWESVDRWMVSGVGFYYPRILVNETLYEKADIRFRYWRTIRVGSIIIRGPIVRVYSPRD